MRHVDAVGAGYTLHSFRARSRWLDALLSGNGELPAGATNHTDHSGCSSRVAARRTIAAGPEGGFSTRLPAGLTLSPARLLALARILVPHDELSSVDSYSLRGRAQRCQADPSRPCSARPPSPRRGGLPEIARSHVRWGIVPPRLVGKGVGRGVGLAPLPASGRGWGWSRHEIIRQR